MKKKILSMLLIATMIVTMCMQTSIAFASQGETEEPFNSTITVYQVIKIHLSLKQVQAA